MTEPIRQDPGRPASGVLGAARGGAPALALALGGTAWLLSLAGLALYLASGPRLTPDELFLLVDVTVGLVYGAVTALVLTRRRHVVGYLLALTSIGGAVSAFAGGWQVFALARGVDAGALADPFGWAWVPGTLAMFLVVPWLVRERPLGRAWWGPAAGALVALAALACSLLGAYDLLMPALAAAVVLGLMTAAATEVRRRRAGDAEAVGLDWLAAGTAVLAASFVPLLLPEGLVAPWLTPALHLASQALFPAAILSVVLRQRLWGVEVAVSRTLLAGALTVGLAAIYLVVSVLLTGLVPGQGLAQALAAAAVVVAVQPTRLWLQRRVRVMVYGVAHDPWRVAGRMGTALGRSPDPEALLASLVESVGTALRLESVTLLAGGPGEEAVMTAWGTASAGATRVPLTAGAEQVGVLAVTARPGEALDARTGRALEELAAVVTSGLVLARTAQELARTRERLTTARLQERRVIRRELHDGLGPWFAGLRLGLQGVANLVETDPAGAREMLAALRAELDQRVEDVRGLARALLPPALEELGLEAALREAAARHGENGFEVRLACDVPPELPAAVAAAAYGIAGEAILNAARHSGAAGCDLEVALDGAALRLSCRDDGAGLAADATPGVGTRAMRERAEELGGHVEIRALVPRGTSVVAVLPVGAR
ncbi:histidine kinase [Georgenia ruanii]|uniref:histidine kinase n=1 Tax=Georgenia ruanii TaxID=348442 RepID=A0A7J9UZ99_9MICO|nr:histidine kinase [Georgenia ruanii]MPV89210.1 sensor histidine kinase [Georgenia ruanii]